MNTSIASTGKTGNLTSQSIWVAWHRSATLRKVLLICGIVSSLHYMAINIIVPMQYAGYSITAQTVSELSAIGAPTRPLWVLLCSFYSLLVIAFGCGVWLAAHESRQLRIAGALMIVYGISGYFWPPMHQRTVLAAGGGTLTDTLHIVFTIVTLLLMMLMMGFGALGLEKRFRQYTIASFVLFMVFGTLTGLSGPKLSAGLPTPMVGVWERINIGIFMLWMIVFAILLLQWEKSAASSIEATSAHLPSN